MNEDSITLNVEGGCDQIRSTNFGVKMLNPKLETLNSKQTQKSKTQNSNLKTFPFEFCILDLFRI